MKLPTNKIQRKANALIVDNVENYRQAAAEHKQAKQQAESDSKSDPKTSIAERVSDRYAMPERAMTAFRMQMDRASGALDALHTLFPDLPAWTETKWIH